jgi:hypothetical protein
MLVKEAFVYEALKVLCSVLSDFRIGPGSPDGNSELWVKSNKKYKGQLRLCW